MSDYISPRKPKPSEDYHELINSYKELHKEKGKFKGISLVPLVPTISKLIKENECKTLLDYGCGKAFPYIKEECQDIGLRKPIQEYCNLESFDLYLIVSRGTTAPQSTAFLLISRAFDHINSLFTSNRPLRIIFRRLMTLGVYINTRVRVSHVVRWTESLSRHSESLQN